jgi:hypothetical protein
MAMFNVTITEEVQYELEVEADSEDEACWQGEEEFLQSEDPNSYPVTVTERQVEAEQTS